MVERCAMPPRIDSFIQNKTYQGLIFRTFFSSENHFPWNFPRHFWGKRYFKTFPQKIPIFPDIFGRKIIRGIFRGKKCPKNRPRVFSNNGHAYVTWSEAAIPIIGGMDSIRLKLMSSWQIWGRFDESVSAIIYIIVI
jgi:hypothetical protein